MNTLLGNTDPHVREHGISRNFRSSYSMAKGRQCHYHWKRSSAVRNDGGRRCERAQRPLKSALLTTVPGSQAARHHQQSVFLIETLFCQDLDSAPFLPRFAIGATVPATESSVLIHVRGGTHSHFLHLEHHGMPHNLRPDRVVPEQEDI